MDLFGNDRNQCIDNALLIKFIKNNQAMQCIILKF
jgi:hypothetical protein